VKLRADVTVLKFYWLILGVARMLSIFVKILIIVLPFALAYNIIMKRERYAKEELEKNPKQHINFILLYISGVIGAGATLIAYFVGIIAWNSF
jgi:hypothetical protein